MQLRNEKILKPDGWKTVQALAQKLNYRVSIHFRPESGRQVNFSKKTHKKLRPFIVASYWPDHGTIRIGPWRRKVDSLLDAWKIVSSMT